MFESLALDAATKGFPSVTAPLPLSQVGRRRWNVLREDVPLPCAVLRETALTNNMARMNVLLQEYGLVLCPHGKTTMSPQLIRRQLEAGAWGITAATATHVAAYRQMGASRILLANQLIGRQAIRTVCELLNANTGLEFYCLVDSVALVEHLTQRVSRYLRPPHRLHVLLEIGLASGRTGSRLPADAMQVAHAVAKQDSWLTLAGVECYEGIVPGEPDAVGEGRIREMFQMLTEVAVACEQQGLLSRDHLVLSAGGSAYVDLAAEALNAIPIERAVRVLRSGCYLTHDDGWLRRHQERARNRTASMSRLPPPKPAIEIWAYVQSVPEPGRLIVTMGKRDVAYDIDLPVPRLWLRPGAHTAPQLIGAGYHVTGLNDQHAYLSAPESTQLRVGDMIGFGISHPCTTFDKWRLLYVVDDDYTITEAVITTF